MNKNFLSDDTEEKVILRIPKGLSENEIKSYIAENITSLYPAMDLIVDDHDDRANLDDVVIKEIHLSESDVDIEYDVEFSAYHGCKDQNYADSDQREINGDRTESELIFKKFIAPQKRTTFEEF
ncbi:hypothetical protein ABQZ99_015060 [Xanthomonas hortorum pv. vitians]|uniref:Uncharacterized protein n=1 Tax=Xanthomonas hortorum pv. vitians TaxID=83224 RepID=A0A6V7D071_9XANT|nr:hypothetical protein [Xanthomonas hortorum]APP83836.1 hypothetical protein BI317_06155 [Xanthomonas hortorum pv. gardneri]MCC8494362.1 hypothetical protein [Xanthomonas hortorum pv. gardneri]MCE4279689.1 hypothetical protein [Xanthomonas hortorum pv. vitians]MCE4286145.1 hypothetical protein [Xanthomonas hortorum pv. vitians]MCE4290916.1 hypothetical protein [Xanthomonas hortorum pv. vitians]